MSYEFHVTPTTLPQVYAAVDFDSGVIDVVDDSVEGIVFYNLTLVGASYLNEVVTGNLSAPYTVAHFPVAPGSVSLVWAGDATSPAIDDGAGNIVIYGTATNIATINYTTGVITPGTVPGGITSMFVSYGTVATLPTGLTTDMPTVNTPASITGQVDPTQVFVSYSTKILATVVFTDNNLVALAKNFVGTVESPISSPTSNFTTYLGPFDPAGISEVALEATVNPDVTEPYVFSWISAVNPSGGEGAGTFVNGNVVGTTHSTDWYPKPWGGSPNGVVQGTADYQINAQITFQAPSPYAGQSLWHTLNIHVKSIPGFSDPANINNPYPVSLSLVPHLGSFVNAFAGESVVFDAHVGPTDGQLHVDPLAEIYDIDLSSTLGGGSFTNLSYNTSDVRKWQFTWVAPVSTPGGSATITVKPLFDHSRYTTYALNVASSISISPGTIPAATAGSAYEQAISATGGGISSYKWKIQGGALPTGLSFTDASNNPVNLVTGYTGASIKVKGTTGSAAVTTTFSITAESPTPSSFGGTGKVTKSYTLTVNSTNTLTVSYNAILNIVDGTRPFSGATQAKFTASGGTGPYAWAITNLPGLLSVSPTTTGNTSDNLVGGYLKTSSFGTPISTNTNRDVTVTVLDSSNPQQNGTLTITLSMQTPEALTFSAPDLTLTGVRGTLFTKTLKTLREQNANVVTYAGGAPRFNYVISGAAPACLSLIPPTADGEFWQLKGVVHELANAPSTYLFDIIVTDTWRSVDAPVTNGFSFDVTASTINVAINSVLPGTQIAVGASTQFTATVTGTGTTSVRWVVVDSLSSVDPFGKSICGNETNGNPTTVGVISSSGVYTAPAILPGVTTTGYWVEIRAISQADNTSYGVFQVQVVPYISASPNPLTLSPNETRTLTGVVNGVNSIGSQTLTVTVNGVLNGNNSVGTASISQSSPGSHNFTVAYTAPTTPGTYTILLGMSTVVYLTTEVSVTVSSGAQLNITPANTQLLVNGTQNFTVSVTSGTPPAINWTIEAQGNSPTGSLSATTGNTVTYTAPTQVPQPSNTITIKATSQSDSNNFATATVTIVSGSAAVLTGLATSPATTPPNGSLNGGTNLIITGANFLPDDILSFSAGTLSPALSSPSYVNSTQFTAVAPLWLGEGALSPAAYGPGVKGYVDLVLYRPSTGVTVTLAHAFQYIFSGPHITLISPSTAAANSINPVVVTITGANFDSGATATFKGAGISTLYIGSTSLQATIQPADLTVVGPFSLQVRNSTGELSNTVTFTVSGGCPVFPLGLQADFDANPAQIGSSYSQSITVTGGTGPYAWSVVGGALPAGVTLGSSTTATVTLSASPVGSAAITSSVTLKVTSSDCPQGTTQSVKIWVGGGSLKWVTAADLDPATVGRAYSKQILASGGYPPYTYIKTGTLPTGLAWSDSLPGITGTPTNDADANQTFDYTVTVIDTPPSTSPSEVPQLFHLPVRPRIIDPTIDTITPNTGPVTGGTQVTITGTGIQASVTVKFGTASAQVIAVSPSSGASSVTCRTPSVVSAGDVNVRIDNSDGGFAVATNGFYFAAVVIPVLDSVDKPNGPFSGSRTITITGHNFSGTSQVLIGGNAATGLNINSDGTQISVVTPSASNSLDQTVAQPVDISVTNTSGTGVMTGGYTYRPAPRITQIIPSSISSSGGSAIYLYITGQNFFLGSGSGEVQKPVVKIGDTVIDPSKITLVEE